MLVRMEAVLETMITGLIRQHTPHMSANFISANFMPLRAGSFVKFTITFFHITAFKLLLAVIELVKDRIANSATVPAKAKNRIIRKGDNVSQGRCFLL